MEDILREHLERALNSSDIPSELEEFIDNVDDNIIYINGDDNYRLRSTQILAVIIELWKCGAIKPKIRPRDE